VARQEVKRRLFYLSMEPSNEKKPEGIKVVFEDEDIRTAIKTYGIRIDLTRPRRDLENYTITRPDSPHLVTNIGQGPKHMMLFAAHGCPHGHRFEFAIVVTKEIFKMHGRTEGDRIKALQEFSEEVLADLHPD
jgi:hypothetical protein